MDLMQLDYLDDVSGLIEAPQSVFSDNFYDIFNNVSNVAVRGLRVQIDYTYDYMLMVGIPGFADIALPRVFRLNLEEKLNV